MRLIDANALVMHMADWQLSASSDQYSTIEEAIDAVAGAPTIDAVPVVRCKDCTYYCPLDDSRPYDCLRSGMLCVRKEDFCSCGKERQ